MVLFSPKLDESARAFETVVFFSRPKDSFTLNIKLLSNEYSCKMKVLTDEVEHRPLTEMPSSLGTHTTPHPPQVLDTCYSVSAD